MRPLKAEILDEILALQLLIGWAGEGRSEPPRCGWWATDLIDEFGGGDFFQRLMPNTHRWAALEAAREAGRRQAEEARKKSGQPDRIRSLFYLGYDMDRQLIDRLQALKASGKTPTEALPILAAIDDEFDAQALADQLMALADISTRQTPGGRQIRGQLPDSPLEQARALAAAHVPFEDDYPQPYFEV